MISNSAWSVKPASRRREARPRQYETRQRNRLAGFKPPAQGAGRKPNLETRTPRSMPSSSATEESQCRSSATRSWYGERVRRGDGGWRPVGVSERAREPKHRFALVTIQARHRHAPPGCGGEDQARVSVRAVKRGGNCIHTLLYDLSGVTGQAPRTIRTGSCSRTQTSENCYNVTKVSKKTIVKGIPACSCSRVLSSCCSSAFFPSGASPLRPAAPAAGSTAPSTPPQSRAPDSSPAPRTPTSSAGPTVPTGSRATAATTSSAVAEETTYRRRRRRRPRDRRFRSGHHQGRRRRRQAAGRHDGRPD